MNRADDHILVRRCLEGDIKAFEGIVDRYEKIIYNAALRIVKNQDTAADVTQSVFLKVYDNLKRFNERYKFFSWIYKIAVNEALHTLRQTKPTDELGDHLVSTEKNPEEVYRENEQEDKIQDALMRIGRDYRVVIVLRHFHDLSYDEIGYVLDIPEKTVKSRLFTARNLLKDILQKEGL